VKIKCRNIHHVLKTYRAEQLDGVSELCHAPDQSEHTWIRDPYQNLFQIVKGESWFSNGKNPTGGFCGVIIGVSYIDASLPLYVAALGFSEVVYDETGTYPDLQPGITYRRVLLRKKQTNRGAFSKLFGHTDIELVQMLDQKPRKIFEDRFWGDLGFIHVCFDVNNMNLLKEQCEELGYEFTVDSASTFDMGEAAGRFSYIEDPDGTLIEANRAALEAAGRGPGDPSRGPRCGPQRHRPGRPHQRQRQRQCHKLQDLQGMRQPAIPRWYLPLPSTGSLPPTPTASR
jgi:catechol 2,3-dioxygenase-like lactoylglutathione lyase family enzyme